jgi:nitrile hydratase accessory protein
LNTPDLEVLPGLPQDEHGPVFAEPWQAQAFALTLRLHAQGAFSWSDWALALSDARASEPDNDGTRYYQHWVAALEGLITGRNLVTISDLAERKDAWAQAYRQTPHGKPVELRKQT